MKIQTLNDLKRLRGFADRRTKNMSNKNQSKFKALMARLDSRIAKLTPKPAPLPSPAVPVSPIITYVRE